MRLRHVLTACAAKLSGLVKARRIKTTIFSGTPVLSGIAALKGETATWSLTFKNGLMLTVGEAGILDYQDRDFGDFIVASGASAARYDLEFQSHLRKIVLKSLLRYITYPGLAT